MDHWLRDVFERLEFMPQRLSKYVDGSVELSAELEVSPLDFLQRAEDDYELGGTAALLNSITNAKRAINSQIDYALACLGIGRVTSITKKVDLLGEMGFLAPRILARVADARNLLEHEYKLPSVQQVEDALDVAALFVEATNRHLQRFEDDFVLGNAGEELDDYSFKRQVMFRYLTDAFSFRVLSSVDVEDEEYWQKLNRGEIQPTHIVEHPHIGASDPVYPLIVRLTLAGVRERKFNESVIRLFEALRLPTGA
jgi:hypothetical protein